MLMKPGVVAQILREAEIEYGIECDEEDEGDFQTSGITGGDSSPAKDYILRWNQVSGERLSTSYFTRAETKEEILETINSNGFNISSIVNSIFSLYHIPRDLQAGSQIPYGEIVELDCRRHSDENQNKHPSIVERLRPYRTLKSLLGAN